MTRPKNHRNVALDSQHTTKVLRDCSHKLHSVTRAVDALFAEHGHYAEFQQGHFAGINAQSELNTALAYFRDATNDNTPVTRETAFALRSSLDAARTHLHIMNTAFAKGMADNVISEGSTVLESTA